MSYELSYVEQKLKEIGRSAPGIYDHILSEDELSEYIIKLIREHSSSADEEKILDSVAATNRLSDYFSDLQNRIVLGHERSAESLELRRVYREHTESMYIADDSDITYSRLFRYLPAQWHTDNFFQIYYAPLDEVSIHFTDDIFRMRPGFLMIVSPGVVHATPCYTDGAVLEHFFLRASTFERVFFELLVDGSILSSFFRRALDTGNNSSAYLVFDTGKDTDIEHIIETMISESIEHPPYSASLMNTLTAQLLILLLRRYEHTARLPQMGGVRWKHEFTEILSYIQNNYSETSQQELSERFGYSTRQINRIIRSSMGMSYNDLIQYLKMRKANELIKQQSLSVKEISELLGYSDVSSFYRAYRKYYGNTPVRYRRRDTVSDTPAEE